MVAGPRVSDDKRKRPYKPRRSAQQIAEDNAKKVALQEFKSKQRREAAENRKGSRGLASGMGPVVGDPVQAAASRLSAASRAKIATWSAEAEGGAAPYRTEPDDPTPIPTGISISPEAVSKYLEHNYEEEEVVTPAARSAVGAGEFSVLGREETSTTYREYGPVVDGERPLVSMVEVTKTITHYGPPQESGYFADIHAEEKDADK